MNLSQLEKLKEEEEMRKSTKLLLRLKQQYMQQEGKRNIKMVKI